MRRGVKDVQQLTIPAGHTRVSPTTFCVKFGSSAILHEIVTGSGVVGCQSIRQQNVTGVGPGSIEL